MLMLLGDIHGNFVMFNEMMKRFPHEWPLTIIQVGDFGFHKYTMKMWPTKFPWKVYAIDGNHEYFPLIEYDVVTEVHDNLFFVPRGTTLTIEGYDIGFVGGAESVDKAWRAAGIDWWPKERVTEADINKLYGKKMDLLVTHAPPISVIKNRFSPINKQSWGLPADWIDESSNMIEKLWKELKYVPLVCGHMHASKWAPNYRILGINEMYFLPVKKEGVAIDLSLSGMPLRSAEESAKAFM